MTSSHRCLASFVWLALACGSGEGGDVPADSVRSAVREHIRASNDAMPFALPGAGAPISLRFDHVHDGVHATPGGRQVVCVDFAGADGTVYDVDFYVDRAGESAPLAVEDAVVHKVAGENVLPEGRRAELDHAS